MSVQALRDLTRLRPLIEAKYAAWLKLGVRECKQASVPHHIHISTCASSSQPPIAPVASTSGLPSTSHNPTPTFSTADNSETPYIPIVQGTKPSRPTFVRATTSPPSLEQQARNASAPIAILSPAPIPQYVRTNAPTVRLLPSPGSPPSKGQYARPLSMPPEASRSVGSNQPLPSPSFDSKVHRLPPPPPVVAGYQHNSRKPAALIPITSPRHLHMHSQSQDHSQSPSHSHHHSYPHSLTRSLSPVRVLHLAPTSTQHQAVQIPIRSSASPPISRSTSLQHASSNSLAGRRLPSPSPPPVERWTKPAAISPKVTSSSPSPPKIASESDGNGIPPGRFRMLILPSDLIDMFAAIALPNTEKYVLLTLFSL